MKVYILIIKIVIDLFRVTFNIHLLLINDFVQFLRSIIIILKNNLTNIIIKKLLI
jgi:hypothetical protein